MARLCSPEAVAARALSLAAHEHGRLGLLLDYDGTLTPIVPHPAQALLSPQVATLLASLAQRPWLRLGVISGRSLESLREVAGELRGLELAVNGGMRIVGSGGEWTHPEAVARRPALAGVARDLATFTQAHRGTELEDKGLTLALHYRNAAEAEHEARRAAREALARHPGQLRMIEGKAVIELQPAIAWDKGRALDELCGRWRLARAIVFIGDDAIDEAGFEAARRRGGLGVRVGNDRPTVAACKLAGVDDVIRLLRLLDETPDQRFERDRG